MGKTKDKLNGLLIVRRCWNLPEEQSVNRTVFDCEIDGRPYRTRDCQTDALIDAIDLSERLYYKLKRLEKKKQSGTDT